MKIVCNFVFLSLIYVALSHPTVNSDKALLGDIAARLFSHHGKILLILLVLLVVEINLRHAFVIHLHMLVFPLPLPVCSSLERTLIQGSSSMSSACF